MNNTTLVSTNSETTELVVKVAVNNTAKCDKFISICMEFSDDHAIRVAREGKVFISSKGVILFRHDTVSQAISLSELVTGLTHVKPTFAGKTWNLTQLRKCKYIDARRAAFGEQAIANKMLNMANSTNRDQKIIHDITIKRTQTSSDIKLLLKTQKRLIRHQDQIKTAIRYGAAPATYTPTPTPTLASGNKTYSKVDIERYENSIFQHPISHELSRRDGTQVNVYGDIAYMGRFNDAGSIVIRAKQISKGDWTDVTDTVRFKIRSNNVVESDLPLTKQYKKTNRNIVLELDLPKTTPLSTYKFTQLDINEKPIVEEPIVEEPVVEEPVVEEPVVEEPVVEEPVVEEPVVEKPVVEESMEEFIREQMKDPKYAAAFFTERQRLKDN